MPLCRNQNTAVNVCECAVLMLPGMPTNMQSWQLWCNLLLIKSKHSRDSLYCTNWYWEMCLLGDLFYTRIIRNTGVWRFGLYLDCCSQIITVFCTTSCLRQECDRTTAFVKISFNFCKKEKRQTQMLWVSVCFLLFLQ